MRPPRVPNLLPNDTDTLYFVTLCLDGRARLLDNDAAWLSICETLRRLDRWTFPAIVVMPDHIHMLAGPVKNRDESLGQMIKWFKQWVNQAHADPFEWQDGGFDRLIRSNETAGQKWTYMRDNPVRAGLVSHWRDWPYAYGFGGEKVL